MKSIAFYGLCLILLGGVITGSVYTAVSLHQKEEDQKHKAAQDAAAADRQKAADFFANSKYHN